MRKSSPIAINQELHMAPSMRPVAVLVHHDVHRTCGMRRCDYRDRRVGIDDEICGGNGSRRLTA